MCAHPIAEAAAKRAAEKIQERKARRSASQSKSKRKRRLALAKEGRCTTCGAEKEKDGYLTCEKCRFECRERRKKTGE